MIFAEKSHLQWCQIISYALGIAAMFIAKALKRGGGGWIEFPRSAPSWDLLILCTYPIGQPRPQQIVYSLQAGRSGIPLPSLVRETIGLRTLTSPYASCNVLCG